MSTRHADDDSPLNQERYMSSPEYAELRGVMGNAATAKASILTSPRKRSLIYFLQALSLERGGLKAVAENLFAMFPERLGTERMIASGIRAGRKLTDEQVSLCRYQLDLESYCETTARGPVPELDVSALLDETYRQYDEREARRIEAAKREAAQVIKDAPHDADYYLAHCRQPERLATFLIDLCVNPRLLISEPSDETDLGAGIRDLEIKRIVEQHESLTARDFTPATFGRFHDICGALFEFQKRYAGEAAESFAKTSVARKVHQTLDACLKARRMVLIEGPSDAGKSTSAEAWCRMHRGEARFVRLQGVSNKTVFFRAIARALGVASSYMRTAKEMQARVEDVLQRSGLCLVLDESQYCFAQSERIYSRPELVDWIYTACCNHKVPVALIASPLFSERLSQAEAQTIWHSDQFKRRIYRFEVLPKKPTRNDIDLVVRHSMPDGDARSVKYLAGHAATAVHPFTAIADTLADAAQIAEAAGRSRVEHADLMEAVKTFRDASDLAKKTAFPEPEKKKKKGKGSPRHDAPSSQDDCSRVSEPLQGAEEPTDFTERSRSVAAPKTPGTRETAPALSDA